MDSFRSDDMGNSFDQSHVDQHAESNVLELEVRKLIGDTTTSGKSRSSVGIAGPSSSNATIPSSSTGAKYYFRAIGVSVVDGQAPSSGIPPSPRTGTMSTGTPRAGGVAGSVSENVLRQAIVAAQRTILSSPHQRSDNGVGPGLGSSIGAVPSGLTRTSSATVQPTLQRRSTSRNTLGGVLLEQRHPPREVPQSPQSQPSHTTGVTAAAAAASAGSTVSNQQRQADDRPCGQCGGLVSNRYASATEVPELEKKLILDIQFYAKSLRRI